MSNATIGSLRVVLGIDTAVFDKGISSVGKSMSNLGKRMASIGAGMSAAFTAPLAVFAANTVKTAGDFEASMNRVDAATGATAKEFTALRQMALALGSDTSKSASESADMMEMLAKNGLSAGQIMDGAAESAIKLSEATGADLSRAADVATNVMAQFGLEAKQLKPIVDQITNVTLASQFGFDDYALALGQAGGVAGALGVDLKDFNAAIAATADTFNSGSDAGTSFKTFLTRLVPQSQDAMKAMTDLNLQFFDANGKMKSMAEIAETLKNGLSGLSDEAKNEALTKIFGQDAMRTAASLASQGGAGIEAMLDKIGQTGVADDQAAARMKGFNGEMEKLSGAMEKLQIAIADSGLLAAITDIVSGFADWVKSLAELNPAFIKWGAIVAAALAAGGPILIGLGLLATALAAISWPAVLVAGAIVLITAAIVKFWPEIKRLGELMAQFVAEEWERFKTAMENGKEIFTNLTAAIGTFLSDSWAKFEGAWDSLVDKVHETKDKLLEFAKSIPQMFADLAARMVEVGAAIIEGLWQGIKGKFAAVKEGLANFATDLVDGVKSSLGIQSPSRVMHEVGENIMQGLTNGMASGAAEAGSVVTDVADTIAVSFKSVEASAAGAGAKIEDAWAGLRDVNAEAKDTSNTFDNMFSGLGSDIAELIKGTKDFRDVVADVAGKIADWALDKAFSGFGSAGLGGIGGFFQNLLGGLFGFANGGSFEVGGAGGIDSQVVAFRASPNETVSVTKPGQGMAGGGRSLVEVVLSPELVGKILEKAGDQSVKITRKGIDQFNKVLPDRFGEIMESQG